MRSNLASRGLVRGSLFLLVAVLVVPAGAAGVEDSAAGGAPTALGLRPAMPAAAKGLNDLLAPSAELPLAVPHSAPAGQDRAGASAPAGPTLAERLRSWDAATRSNALLEVELRQDAPAALVGRARAVEALWNGGEPDAAIEVLAELEATGAGVALGVGCRVPLATGGGRDWTDTRIGTRTGGSFAELDYDADSGALYALVRWETDHGWGLYRSTDDGASWAETYFWSAGAGAQAADVDMAVVAGYVYVGYVASDYADEARLRRCFAATGASDTVYGYQVPLDASPSTFTDVAVESNADSFDNRVYLAARQATGALRWAWDVATDGLTFTEESPAVVDATGGLDLHWNYGYTAWFVVVSYIGDDARVHVLRKSVSGWDEAASAPFDGSHDRTAISAWDDHIICAHEVQMTNGQGIRYFISHDGGDTWDYYNYVFEPDAGEGPYQMADVTARGGAGTAIVCTHEVGEPDDVLIRYRRYYAPGLWRPELRVNDHDVSTGTWTAINWTPRDTENGTELSYGMIYFYGTTPYFTRLQRLPGDMNCDGVLDFADINAFVLALSSPAVYEALYPDCDWLNADCNADGSVSFGDINPFVGLLTGL